MQSQLKNDIRLLDIFKKLGVVFIRARIIGDGCTKSTITGISDCVRAIIARNQKEYFKKYILKT